VNQATLEPFVAFREKYQVPVWLGESGENTDEWIERFRTLLEKNGIGWAFWPYKKMDATSSPVSFARPLGGIRLWRSPSCRRGDGAVKGGWGSGLRRT